MSSLAIKKSKNIIKIRRNPQLRKNLSNISINWDIYYTAIFFLKQYIDINVDITIITQDVYDNFYFPYKLNYIFVVLGFTKIFIGMRVLLLNQVYMNPRCKNIGYFSKPTL